MNASSLPAIVPAPPSTIEVEHLVIGSGPGGAITAAYLAEAGRDVLVIEEGPYYALESCMPFTREEMVQKYRNGGVTVALGPTKVAYVEGRCVGGGSEINSGLYHRTPEDILARWRNEYEVRDLTPEALRQHFEQSEQDVNVSYLPGRAPEPSLRLHNGAMALGWKSMEVPRWFKYEPQTDPNATPKGSRQSMTRTFMPRLLRAGGRILPRSRVLKLCRLGSHWIASVHTAEGAATPSRQVEIRAKTVHVSAGAIQTPTLLQRSGLRKNIGTQLKLHATVKAVARFNENINSLDTGVPVHQVKEFAPRYSFGCSIGTPPYLQLAMLDHPGNVGFVDEHWRQMAIYYAMISGGVGSVRALPGYRDPLVRYKLTWKDHADLGDALRDLCRCLQAGGAAELWPSIAGSPVVRSEMDIATIPKELPVGRTNLMTIHLFGSCPMGERRDRCAADSFGKVFGTENLYLADASLLCGAPGVNPQGTIMALVRRNVLHFLEGDR